MGLGIDWGTIKVACVKMWQIFEEWPGRYCGEKRSEQTGSLGGGQGRHQRLRCGLYLQVHQKAMPSVRSGMGVREGQVGV